MRMTLKHIISVAAAVLTLFSCAKNLPVVEPETPGTGEGSERVITASFGSASKTYPGGTDGLTPIFSDGDLIKVTNGTAAPQVCTVKVSGSVTFFRTTLTGPLKAVYPADAAVVSGNQITGVSVPANPSGCFKDANIAMAEGITTEARFRNQTAILRFYVDAAIGVKSITITSTEDIATGYKTITVNAGSSTLDQVTDDPEHRICYVPVLKDVNTHYMAFESVTTGQGQGTVTKTMTADNTLQVSKMYNIFIPYYIDLGSAGKWGYCNVGAFLPEEYGWYFSWGNVDAYDKVPDYWVSAADGSQFIGGFSEANYNSSSGHALSTNIPETAQYDAACAYWGEGWRMPTGGPYASAEFVALFNACREEGYTSGAFTPEKITTVPTTQGVYFYNVSSGSKGLYFVNAEGTKLFLPYAGYGDGNVRYAGGVYWSSTRYGVNACALDYTSTEVKPRTYYTGRYGGSIRPVFDSFNIEGELSDYDADEFDGVPQDEPLSGVFTVSNGPDGIAGTADDKKVQFSKGNLRYTLSTSQWSFFENQYDCGADTYAGGHGAEISLFTWGKSFWSYVPDGTGYYEGVEDISGTSRDWGTGKWRTLTYDEWIYLLNSRSITEKSRGYAKAHLWNDRYGIIIFPDGYSTTVTSGNGIQTVWGEDFPTTMISEADWTVMENNGAVFLPAAGHREGDTIKFAQKSDGYLHAEYWTSSLYYDTVEYASYITIGDNRDSSPKYWDFPGGSNTSKSAFRSEGMSVRLVTDVVP